MVGFSDRCNTTSWTLRALPVAIPNHRSRLLRVHHQKLLYIRVEPFLPLHRCQHLAFFPEGGIIRDHEASFPTPSLHPAMREQCHLQTFRRQSFLSRWVPGVGLPVLPFLFMLWSSDIRRCPLKAPVTQSDGRGAAPPGDEGGFEVNTVLCRRVV